MTSTDTTSFDVWCLDLDGVVWRGKTALPGSVEAIEKLLSNGEEVTFVTNNSAKTMTQNEQRLIDLDIEAKGRVITSALAVGSLVERGEKVVVLGGEGICEAVHNQGGHVVEHGPADAVIVGLDHNLTYERLRSATLAIHNGARFLASNDDATYPHEDEFWPGGGTLVAAVQTAVGHPPIIAGKPHDPMKQIVQRRYGKNGIMIGDRPETDGLFAQNMGYHFGLVLSGVTQLQDLPVQPAPTHISENLAELITKLLVY